LIFQKKPPLRGTPGRLVGGPEDPDELAYSISTRPGKNQAGHAE
jgi:hypothetical protein